ncbi:MAG: efflux RND transporter periplasmic adaptor subunit [Kiritimatiellae bacterium]|nr:efflux RND transporter periplasmic adaptor subunit [Kiritimatiellia bacterium]
MKELIAAACACMAAIGFAQGRPAPVVSVENPVEVKEGEPKSYVGVLKASERVSVTAQVAGKIWTQNFREGGRVEKGQTLFEIEDTVFKANLATAKANLKRLEAQLALAEKEVERYKKALEKKGVSENDYDRAVNSRDVTLADIETAKARIALAENDMVYTKVLSPISGTVGETKIRVGNNVSPQTGELVSIVQSDPIDIQFALSESDFYRSFDGRTLRGNVRLEVRRADGEAVDRKISVDFVDNQVDHATDTIMVQLVADNADGMLVPGGYAKVLLTEKFEPAKIAVKVSAVMFEGEKRFVYVVGDDDVAERREIKTGVQIGDLQLVESGLSADERVVVTGIHKVIAGQAVVAR